MPPVAEEPEVDNGVDECASSYVDAPLIITADPCGLGRCIDTPSTFTCECPTGMIFDRARGATCVA